MKKALLHECQGCILHFTIDILTIPRLYPELKIACSARLPKQCAKSSKHLLCVIFVYTSGVKRRLKAQGCLRIGDVKSHKFRTGSDRVNWYRWRHGVMRRHILDQEKGGNSGLIIIIRYSPDDSSLIISRDFYSHSTISIFL